MSAAIEHVERHWNTLRRRSAFVGRVVRRPGVAVKRCRYLFLFGHMRSRSTLLGHLLGSHPEISGHLETHIRYRRRRDFQKLRFAVSDAHCGSPLRRYVMDKVVQPWYADIDLLDRAGVTPIFLLREPDEAIQSIYHFRGRRSIEKALNHYLTQARWLAEVAGRFRSPRVFVRSSSIIEDTDSLFRMLERALELSTPLSEEYEIFAATGTLPKGDNSALIHSGLVQRSGETSYEGRVTIPAERLAEAEQCHRECVAKLESLCLHLPSA